MRMRLPPDIQIGKSKVLIGNRSNLQKHAFSLYELQYSTTQHHLYLLPPLAGFAVLRRPTLAAGLPPLCAVPHVLACSAKRWTPLAVGLLDLRIIPPCRTVSRPCHRDINTGFVAACAIRRVADGLLASSVL